MDEFKNKVQFKIGAEVILLMDGIGDPKSIEDVDVNSMTVGDVKLTLKIITPNGEELELDVDHIELTEEATKLITDLIQKDRA